MKQFRDFMWLLIGMAGWALAVMMLGIVLRMNWEIFLFGWNSI